MHRTYLASHVKEALAADPRVASLDLRVDVRDNVVHLVGEVASENVRRSVDDILRSLPEVAHFVNHTRVRHLAAPGVERVVTEAV